MSLEKFQTFLFLLSSKRQLGIGWANFLYISLPIELGIFVTMLVFNFLGMVPTIDYYWSILLHIFHTFSWAAVYACLSKNFSLPFYRATLVLYGFATLLDFAAFIWRVITTSICTSTQCVDERTWGIVGYILSLVLVFWDIGVFVSIVFVIRGIIQVIVQHAQQVKRNSQESLSAEGGRSDHPETDAAINSEYAKIVVEPPSISKFSKRFAIVICAILEPIFYFGILIITMFGLVISELFLWTIFLGGLHFFTWVFLVACIYNNYSRSFQIAAQALYATNIVLDLAALVWRSVLLINCDPATNVDCIFRSFPDWFPIQLFSGILVIIDIVAFISLVALYRWLTENIWRRIEESEAKILQQTKKIGLVKRKSSSSATAQAVSLHRQPPQSFSSSSLHVRQQEERQDELRQRRSSTMIIN